MHAWIEAERSVIIPVGGLWLLAATDDESSKIIALLNIFMALFSIMVMILE